jgi:hypothetical protein
VNTILVGCTGTYGERIDQTLRGIRAIRPYTDRMVVVIDETVTEKQKQQLQDAGAEVYMHPWEDNMVKMRNQLLQKLQTGDWAVCFDPDECYDEKFCKDLPKIIAKAEEQGIGLLIVAAHDETLMNNGSVSKSVSGFKKPWIFKKNLGMHYEGVGETRNVHETPVLAPNTKIEALADEYFYTHYKYEWEIWERAARNVFMCGGGGNVGERNTQWKRLRTICDSLGIKNWTQARAYFRRGKVDPALLQWLIDNRFEGTDYEHEMKDFFLWYKYLHPDELRNFEAEPNPKEGTTKEIEKYVETTFRDIVGSEIPEADKQGLTEMIMDGRIPRNALPNVLNRYKQGQPPPAQAKTGEKVRIPVPVDVDVRVTEDLFEKALLKSRLYWERIKPRMDVGKFIEDHIWDRTKFYRWFYENQEQLKIDDIFYYAEEHGINSVALCIMGYSKAMPMILESLNNCACLVNEMHVQGDDFTEEDIAKLKDLNCQVHIEPWKDDFSDYKNKLLAHANTQWVLVCDHDEIPTPELAKNLSKIIAESENGKKYDLVGLQVIGMTVNQKGEVVHTGEKVQGKQNLHVNIYEAYQGTPHVGLKMEYYPWKTISVPYSYKHVKEEGIDLHRSARNVFLGGGGDNVKDKNPLWLELIALTHKLRIDDWKGFDAYLHKGSVDGRLKNWFLKARVFPWKDDELTHVEKYYYEIHPEESYPNSVAMCIMTERTGVNMVIETVKAYRPFFDEVVIQSNDLVYDEIEDLKALGANVFIEPWNDEFSDYKNKCVCHAKSEWVLILDYDEIPTDATVKTLRTIIENSDNGTKYNIVGFESIDRLVDDDGKVLEEGKPANGKELLHLNVFEPYSGTPHIWLKQDYFPWKPIQIYTGATYYHVKTEMKMLKQATLNFFLGGAGDNLRDKNPLWLELKAVTDELGLKTWAEFDAYLKQGHVDHRLLEVFKKAEVQPWHCPELKQPMEYYRRLHPEEVMA